MFDGAEDPPMAASAHYPRVKRLYMRPWLLQLFLSIQNSGPKT